MDGRGGGEEEEGLMSVFCLVVEGEVEREMREEGLGALLRVDAIDRDGREGGG